MQRPAAGLSPGTLVHRGPRYVETPLLAAHAYTADGARRLDVDAAHPPQLEGASLWLEVTGVHDAELMARITATYGIPALMAEDVMQVGQRPKYEPDEQGSLLVLRMLQWVGGRVAEEQVSLWWREGVLVSFQEKPGDCLEPIRGRLHGKGGRIRNMGTAYLAYAIADALVDHVFLVLESVGESLAAMEEAVLEDWRGVSLQTIQEARRSLAVLRRAVGPTRDVAAALLRDESMPDAMQPFLRDLHDHAVQAMDQAEQQREAVAGLRDLWMNAQAAHMNRVMQVLTVTATVFIPLTFLAGLYGMNFEHMPELGYRWSYPVFLTVNAALAVGLLTWFRRKGWMG